MKGAPRSMQFDDIYFSAENGLEETKHVFLRGNNLPQAWENQESFVVAETGFGTGLNFLSAWKLFEETAKLDQTLDFISIEKYPLSPQEIKKALDPWAEYFEGRIDMLCAQYPIRIAGFHRVKINSQITLTLIFDDIAEALPQIDAQVDAWFLDGFTPAKNPDMWSEVLYQQMARLSHDETSYATFTAAGNVRRGLEVAGFSVQKTKGFGRKRDMVVGNFQQGQKKNFIQKPQIKSVAIIGGGLAGTSCAHVLRQYGFDPVIYEASDSVASGASGNVIGLYNPRFSKFRDNLSAFFAPAYAQFIRMAKQAQDIDYAPCGGLHLMMDSDKEKRFKSMAHHWEWHSDHVKVLSAEEASDIAGIEIECEALYLPDSGYVSPQKLCAYYARGVEVHTGKTINDLSELKEDAVILATGPTIKNFECLSWLPLDAVRGQVSILDATEKSQSLKCTLCYGGYLAPEINGTHIVGSTFEKWVDHTKVCEKNHKANIETLKANIPALAEENFVASSGRAGMRAATNDRFPVVGQIADCDNAYVSAAFGSHGLVGSILAAHYLADCLRGGPKSVSLNSVKELNPKRFLDRAQKKGRDLRKTMIQ